MFALFETKKTNKIINTYLKQLTHTTRQVGVDHAAGTQCLEFFPNGRMKK